MIGRSVAMAAVAISLGAFAVTGARSLRQKIPSIAPALSRDPFVTTNRFLTILAVDQPAERVREALAQFPPDAELLFVADESESFSTQVWFTLVTVAYPRNISAIMCNGPRAPTVWDRRLRRNLDGLIFFEVPHPAANRGTFVGPKLFLTKDTSGAEWSSFCQ